MQYSISSLIEPMCFLLKLLTP